MVSNSGSTAPLCVLNPFRVYSRSFWSLLVSVSSYVAHDWVHPFFKNQNPRHLITFRWHLQKLGDKIFKLHAENKAGKGKAVPLQAWSGPEGSRKLRFPDFVTIARDGGKVVSITHRPLFTPRKYSWYSFLLEAESTPGPHCDQKDFISMKNSLIPAGIKPATFRFVAQHLNHCATAVPE